MRRGALAMLVLAAAAGIGLADQALAQNPLGIGAGETAAPSTGLFAGVLGWINAQQQAFYRALTGALKSMRDEGTGQWLLVGLSFAYGVFHAAGPGHGKAVISSYMLANEVALRRGIVISFASSLLQAITAIAVMTLLFLALRGTSVSMADTTRFLELASYALVAAFGAWLLWRKLGSPLSAALRPRVAHSLSAAHVHDHGTEHGGGHRHHHHHDHDHHHHHDHEPEAACTTCGHAHAPDPGLLAGRSFDLRSAWTAIVAVGIRPCSGALIVLGFAFLNGLWAAGVLSVLAMGLGTAITVSLLATLAVTAKNWAVAISGGGAGAARVHDAIEIIGALLVLLLGLALLAAGLQG